MERNNTVVIAIAVIVAVVVLSMAIVGGAYVMTHKSPEQACLQGGGTWHDTPVVQFGNGIAPAPIQCTH